ncbi:MAG: hypothetical protein Ct9H300mP21_01010 [Pseudomonadota bacterium]|nr:MAG: hypothetical protein Ct9H300mP21_01010 [Pseudomonadota bacterium]
MGGLALNLKKRQKTMKNSPKAPLKFNSYMDIEKFPPTKKKKKVFFLKKKKKFEKRNFWNGVKGGVRDLSDCKELVGHTYRR